MSVPTSEIFAISKSEIAPIFSSSSFTRQKSEFPNQKHKENQDAFGLNIVADGIGSKKDCEIDAKYVVSAKLKFFEPRPINQSEVFKQLTLFNNHLKEYQAENHLIKLRTTFSFFVPFLDNNGQEKLLLVTQGDSSICGVNLMGKLIQLSTNSHPLFEHIIGNKDP
jgi:serine/threonine protein phosphatase PrpC